MHIMLTNLTESGAKSLKPYTKSEKDQRESEQSYKILKLQEVVSTVALDTVSSQH